MTTEDTPTPPTPPRPDDAPPPTTAKGGTYDLDAGSHPEPPKNDLSVKCPGCGAAMPGGDTLVCLRCGFDLKSLKRLETTTGVTDVSDEEAPPAPPLSRPGRGERWLPAALAIGSGALLVLGHLFGAGGLFSGAEEATFPDRLLGLLQALVQVAVLTGSGLAGLLVTAQLLETKVGDWPLAAMRMLGIACSIRLCTFFSLTPRSVEWTLESAAQLAIAIALASFFFRFNWRDGLSWAVVAVVSVAATWLIASLVTWGLA